MEIVIGIEWKYGLRLWLEDIVEMTIHPDLLANQDRLSS